LRQEATLESLFIENRLSGVIHLAFIIPPFSELTPDLAREVNVEGTQRIIKFTEQYAKEASFLFGSSVATFGTVNPSVPPLSLNKNQPIPTNNYTAHKIICEVMAKQSDLNWRILRFSVVMNPTFRPSKESLKYSRRVPLETKVEPVHVKDLAVAVCNALNNPNASKRTFIISGGEKNRTTYRDYVFRSMNAYLGNIEEDQIPWEKFSEDPYYLHWYDTTESEKLLKFQKRTIEDYLKDMKESIPFWQRIMLPISRKTALKILFL
jgi:nucleoside-diphosphate-sugar epimerase